MDIAQHFNSLVEHIVNQYIQSILERLSQIEGRMTELEPKVNKSYLTQKEVCKIFKIGHRTLKKWVANGLNEIWLDKRVYYDRRDIEVFLENYKL
ncbi:Helix-turn-helix domain-containing protein [Ignavigranum ruoffiae]|uniref:Helix-turn-helix domain-containing protein n=1 Tax=Ignavigranum ruoffiae TaxID=89093 RepID=A0A1H9GZY6_9LACT|nr:helix-turn-helix domain-containing protein [Ignavigranum ruoffiae]SEQ55651.1 Helix-turn-helix domain-containing protein [Ignavigranum ruoffiae]